MVSALSFEKCFGNGLVFHRNYQCNALVMIEYYTDITYVTLWSLMVKPKKNSGARDELLALICFILEPELSFLALILYFGARAKFFGSGIFFGAEAEL